MRIYNFTYYFCISLQVFCVSVAILLVCQSTALVLLREKPNQKVVHSFLQKIEYIDPQNKVGADLCPTCISFTGEAINELLNLILRKCNFLTLFFVSVVCLWIDLLINLSRIRWNLLLYQILTFCFVVLEL